MKMGNLFSHPTTYENPEYGTAHLKRNMAVASKCIEFFETKDNGDAFYESKVNYNRRVLNGAVRSIPPSQRSDPEFLRIITSMQVLGFEILEPIKYTIIPN